MIRHLLVLLGLAAVTLLLADGDARFKPVGQVFPELNPFGGGDWRHSRIGVSGGVGSPPEIRLAAHGLGKLTYIARRIPRPKSFKYLRVSAEVRSDVGLLWHPRAWG